MSYLLWFIFFYFLGGLTFIPIVGLLFFLRSRRVLPKADRAIDNSQSEAASSAYGTESKPSPSPSSASSSASSSPLLNSTSPSPPPVDRELESGTDAFFSGWLTVSREYFIYPTGGTNNIGNPPSLESSIASLNKNESAYSTLYKIVKGSKANDSSPASSASSPSRRSSTSSTAVKKSSLVKYFAVCGKATCFYMTALIRKMSSKLSSWDITLSHSGHQIFLMVSFLSSARPSVLCAFPLATLLLRSLTMICKIYCQTRLCHQEMHFIFIPIFARKKRTFILRWFEHQNGTSPAVRDQKPPSLHLHQFWTLYIWRILLATRRRKWLIW